MKGFEKYLFTISAGLLLNGAISIYKAYVDQKSKKKIIHVKKLHKNQKVILITGGAGFIGSHLVEKLVASKNNFVVVMDNFITGIKSNIDSYKNLENFLFVRHDITQEFDIDELDEVYHLASLASPKAYMMNSIETIMTNIQGTINILNICQAKGAKMLLTSTSEIYGDPEVHPQVEEYFGSVNTMGPRSCYDESKRTAETLAYEYQNKKNVDIRIARIFNTYGPRMKTDDGRVISNFIIQALKNEPLTVYGDGSQTRSLLYISDLIEGLIKLMESKYTKPINIGYHSENTVSEIAEMIIKAADSSSKITYSEKMQDDPRRRKPDITKAKTILNWYPSVQTKEGIDKTIEYFKSII